MMMLNTKLGVAILALVASSASTAAVAKKNDEHIVHHHKHRRQHNKRQKRHLRKGPNGHRGNVLKDDITEDVAFWTRSLQGGSINPIPPPTPTPPTPRPPTPPTPTPPTPTDPVTPMPTFDDTDPPVTSPPVPAPSNTPVARPDSASVSGGGDVAFVSVLVNDTPAPGESLTVKTITEQANNGECSISLDLSEVVYAPDDGFSGTDSCVYEACDGAAPPECDTATLTVTVG